MEQRSSRRGIAALFALTMVAGCGSEPDPPQWDAGATRDVVTPIDVVTPVDIVDVPSVDTGPADTSSMDATVVDAPVSPDVVVARDVAPVRDGIMEDSPVVSACGPRMAAGACTPGAPGCDLVTVSLGSEIFSPGACAVFSDGSLRCWSVGCGAPGVVAGIERVQAARHGGAFLCAVRDGSAEPVWCWGANNDAQFGTRTPLLSAAFIATPLPRGVLQLGGSSGFSVAPSGTVTAWGRNQYGQLGDGTIEQDSMQHGVAPHEVLLTGLRQLALEPLNGWVACGVFEGGGVRCWGRGVGGHFGTALGATAQSAMPVVVPGIDSVRELAVGPRFVCGVRTDNTLWCWGLGNDPRMSGASLTPSRVLDRVTQAVVGGPMACALRDDMTVWCWGAASVVGNGGSGLVAAPTQVRGLTDVRAIYGGVSSVCARRGTSGADLWCWGSLATVPGADGSPTPVQVTW